MQLIVVVTVCKALLLAIVSVLLPDAAGDGKAALLPLTVLLAMIIRRL